MASSNLKIIVSLDVTPALRQLMAVLAATTPVCDEATPNPGLPDYCRECGHLIEAHEAAA